MELHRSISFDACSSMDEDTDLHSFRHAVRNSQHVVVAAGAGLSAVSAQWYSGPGWMILFLLLGIPTFTDGGGMWRSLERDKFSYTIGVPVGSISSMAILSLSQSQEN